jgi:hypothetical protein
MLPCAICNGKIEKKDINFNPAVKDGVVCAACASICDNYEIKTCEAIKSYWAENRRRASVFSMTRVFKNFLTESVSVDDVNRLFRIGKPNGAVYFAFNEVREFGEREVGSFVQRSNKSNVTRVFMFVISLDTFYGKKAVHIRKPPKGIEKFLSTCV